MSDPFHTHTQMTGIVGKSTLTCRSLGHPLRALALYTSGWPRSLCTFPLVVLGGEGRGEERRGGEGRGGEGRGEEGRREEGRREEGRGGEGRGGEIHLSHCTVSKHGVGVTACASCVSVQHHSPTARANPKSHSLTTPSFDTRMFSGLTSLWMIWGVG